MIIFSFAKNLKPEQISLEVLGGTGELRNIVLNEAVLTEKLELPPFLKLKKAECNRVKVKVPWTKLNSSPVQIVRINKKLFASVKCFHTFR